MDIDTFLESGIDMFEMEVKRRYADRDDADRVWRTAERIAQLVHEDVQILAVGNGNPAWNEIRATLAELDLEEDLDFALQARLAWHLRPSFERAAKKCWELAGLLRRAEPSDVVQRFLDRVARCYLLDFVPECLVMCRGALENGLNARYGVERVTFPVDGEGRATMKMRLQEAERRNWIAPSTANALHELRRVWWTES